MKPVEEGLVNSVAAEALPGRQHPADEALLLGWVTDAQGVCVGLSRRAEKCFESPQQCSVEAWAHAFLYPEDLPGFLDRVRTAQAAHQSYQFHCRARGRNDSALWWIRGTAVAGFDAQGRFTGYCAWLAETPAPSEAPLQPLWQEWQDTGHRQAQGQGLPLTHQNAAGLLVHVSPSCTQLLGRAPRDLLGRPAEEWIHPEDAPRLHEELAAQLRGDRPPLPVSLRVLGQDGPRWVDLMSQVMLAPQDGTIAGVVSLWQAVSKEASVQEQQPGREERLRSLIKLSSDGYWETDAEGRFTLVSEAASNWLGEDPSVLLGKSREELAADRNDPGLRAYLDKVGRREPFRDLVITKMLRRDARVVHLSLVGEPMYRDGVFVGYRGLMRDVSARRAAEAALASTEARYARLIESTPEGYFRATADLRIAEVNPALCRMSGYVTEELVGQPLSLLFSDDPFDRALAPRDQNAFEKDAAVRHRDGYPVHVLMNATIERDAQGAVLSLTAFLNDITQRKQVEKRLEHLATHDVLTQLPNRTLLHQRADAMLAAALESGESLAVMFIDLDRFKGVNDSLGHEAGDLLLKEVAQRLREYLRSTDFVARLGGDEFVVLLPCAMGALSAAVVAEKLLDRMAAPLDIEGQELFLGASIGISLYPENGETKEVLFQNADIAMYRAKAAGRNAYRFFTREMGEAARTRLTIENALRRAIERGEFELHYQPRVDLITREMVGMEALLRWNHPYLGRVPPAQFIPIAEEAGLIGAIGHWVLQQACRQNQAWRERFGRPLVVSVNLAPRQLHDRHLGEKVRQALRSAGMEPQLLELELTEGSLMQDPRSAAQALAELKALGLRLAVDDFGTGHSSLVYLRHFPLDVLKLDRAFLTELTEEASLGKLAQAIIHLAHAMNMRVVGEGVEAEAVLDFLREAGCDEAQGYHLGRPVPAAEFERLLSSRQAAVRGEEVSS